MSEPTSTADYRKYPKGPNFGLIVLLFVVTIFVIGICAYIVLRVEGRKMVPKVPDNHPTSQMIRSSPSPLSRYAAADC